MPLARHHLAQKRTPQVLDNVVGKLPTFIESFIDNRPILTHLCEIVAIETGISTLPGVGDMNISNAATGRLIHAAAVVFDPREMPKVFFTVNGNNRNVAGILPIRIGSNFEHDLLSGSLLEEAKDVVSRVKFPSIDGENVASDFDIHARLRQRRFIPRIPVFPAVHLSPAISIVLEAVVRPEQSTLELLRLRIHFAATDEHVANRHFSQALLE